MSAPSAWEVASRDRIAYILPDPFASKANVVVTFCWTMRDVILPRIAKENLAMATNFYTPSGLESMVRNILANPCIRYVILLGEEYASRKGDPAELTSANAIRTFFAQGVLDSRKLPGFENAVYFDVHIPLEEIRRVQRQVELVDLNMKMPDASVMERIAEASRLLGTLPKKEPFAAPQVFGQEPASSIMPYGGGPYVVRGTTIPKTWVEVIHAINRYGRKNLMDANTDREVKEINNMVAVITDPQSMDLSLNPFLVPMTPEKVRAYCAEILSPELPPGKAYTYGNKLRAYHFPDAGYIQDLKTTAMFKDFEFGQGPHIDENVQYTGHGAEIDQVKDMIFVLKRNLYAKSILAIAWHPADELSRKHKSSPCLVLVQPMVQDERLNLTVYFRSHDMVQGWPENAYGMAAIQKELADAVQLPPGILTIISSSAQIYKNYYSQVGEMIQKFRRYGVSYNDPVGNYIITVKEGRIVVSHTDPLLNKDLERFEGKTAQEVYLQIAAAGHMDTGHALYLGTELQKAEYALKDPAKEYVQDQELRQRR